MYAVVSILNTFLNEKFLKLILSTNSFVLLTITTLDSFVLPNLSTSSYVPISCTDVYLILDFTIAFRISVASIRASSLVRPSVKLSSIAHVIEISPPASGPNTCILFLIPLLFFPIVFLIASFNFLLSVLVEM